MIKNEIKKNVLNKVMKKIKEEKANIEKVNQIDKKYYNMNISIDKLLEITEELKKQDLEENMQKDIFVIHNGNPYITYILAIKAIVNEINMKIYVNETMLGTNLILIQIINQVTKEFKVKTNLTVTRDVPTNESNILILGDRSYYRRCIKGNIKCIRYKANTNISIYVENQELEELKKNIIKYCSDNLIEIEVYEAENIEDAIDQIKADYQGEKVMLLTKEKIDQEIIKGIPITINENILKNFEKELVKEKIL